MSTHALELTSSLEDYLETIYELVRDQKLARVKDIAKARGVRAGSVSPAMKRLAAMGLIRYVRREYIDLTPEGTKQAQRVYAKHQVLTRLFQEVLGLPADQARANACAMEHSLTAKAMSRLVRFFEFLSVCPDGNRLMELFHTCSLVSGKASKCAIDCSARSIVGQSGEKTAKSISNLKPGESGVVAQVKGRGAIRQRLLDMGILPGVSIEVERVAPKGGPVWIKLQGFPLSLRRREADTVLIAPSE